jgi:SAM-dependent methyltransferase
MEERLERETEGLKRSWGKFHREALRAYLVQGVEDPRINVQSVLTRHFLVRALFGEQFDELAEHELRFSLVMNWLLDLLKRDLRIWQLQGVLDALISGEDQAEGTTIPEYVSKTFATLAMPNYMCALFNWAPSETEDGSIPDYLMVTFQTIWREVLDGEQPERISVVEPACGSANDYRFIEGYGIGGLIDYLGFDLCEKNIRNAKALFPEACFKVGNVFEIEATDKAFDFCFVHDLFEHLSLYAMETAISEVCRVTRKGICVGFFNMHEGSEHIVTPVEDYHWNKLSAPRTKEMFEQYVSSVEVVGIDEFLKSRFRCGDTHNKGAYTFVVRM